MTTMSALELLAKITTKHTAFIGLGNRDRGDDAIGLRFVDDLSQLNPNFFFVEKQGMESIILKIIKDESIENVVFVDSCDLEKEPGEIDLITVERIDETISTHKVPLSMFMALIQKEGKDAYLLGIQPKSLDLDSSFSKEIVDALEKIEDIISSNLK